MIKHSRNIVSTLPIRLLLLTLLLVGLLAVYAAPTEAKTLPKITGGGTTENFNHGIPVVPPLLSVGGFNARATGPGLGGVYSAKGQIQAKAVLANDPSTTLGSIHGTVVCIANLGPSSGVDGGGNPDNDVWGIRFQVTKAKGAFSVPVGSYGSAFVQDNGKVDSLVKSLCRPN